jgi:hypothetical protein
MRLIHSLQGARIEIQWVSLRHGAVLWAFGSKAAPLANAWALQLWCGEYDECDQHGTFAGLWGTWGNKTSATTRSARGTPRDWNVACSTNARRARELLKSNARP